MADELGAFQDIWDAWDEARDEIMGKPLSHFRRAVEVQFSELESHLAADNREAAAREAIDVISIALNLLRWLEYTPKEIGDIARSRADLRMRGQAHSILEKYKRLYGI
jgi:hypothetical protein